MNILKYVGAAICALCGIIVLRGQKSGFALGVSLTASLLLLGVAVHEFLPIIVEVEQICSEGSFSKWVKTLMKSLGIAITVQIGGDICRDSGESAIAAKLEMIGKAEIVLLALPLVRELLELSLELVR